VGLTCDPVGANRRVLGVERGWSLVEDMNPGSANDTDFGVADRDVDRRGVVVVSAPGSRKDTDLQWRTAIVSLGAKLL